MLDWDGELAKDLVSYFFNGNHLFLFQNRKEHIFLQMIMFHSKLVTKENVTVKKIPLPRVNFQIVHH